MWVGLHIWNWLVCALASASKVFLAVNHNGIIMISPLPFPVSVAPEKPELTRPSSQAITAGETTSSEVCVCLKSINVCASCVWVRVFWFSFEHRRCTLHSIDFSPHLHLSDWYLCDNERTSPAKNYLVQRWPAPTRGQGQEGEYVSSGCLVEFHEQKYNLTSHAAESRG